MKANSPFAHYTPFPEPPALIADYIAEKSAEESVVDGPSPWDIGALPTELLAPIPTWLDAVIRWLNQTYAWQPHQVIPPCWTQHDHLPYEVAALAFARADAYEDAGSAVAWHEQYDRFLTRMNNALGKAGDECRNGRHDDRPSSAWTRPVARPSLARVTLLADSPGPHRPGEAAARPCGVNPTTGVSGGGVASRVDRSYSSGIGARQTPNSRKGKASWDASR